MSNESTIKKDIILNAPAAKVWEVLVDPQYTRQWGNEFMEGTWVETDWNKGSEVLWKDKEGNVMVKGIVVANEHSSLLKVAFYDDVNMEPPAPTGAYMETYILSGQDGQTRLAIESGPLKAEDYNMLIPLWDKALAKIKELAEQ